MERILWTDERVDDALTHISSRFDQIDRRFDQVGTHFDRLETGLGDIRREMHDIGRELRTEISTNARQMTQVGWALVGILIVQLIAVVVALS